MDDDAMSMQEMIPLMDGEEPTPKPTTKIDLVGKWEYSQEKGTFVRVVDPPEPPKDPNAALGWGEMVPAVEAGKPGEVPADDWTGMVPAIPAGGVPKEPSGPPPSAKDPGQVVPDAGDQPVADVGDGLEVPRLPGGQAGQEAGQ